MAATQDIAKSYGWEVGNQYVNSFNLMDIPESKTTGAVFNEIDYMANQSGNSYYGDMFANASTFLPESLIANENGYAEAWQQRNANISIENILKLDQDKKLIINIKKMDLAKDAADALSLIHI